MRRSFVVRRLRDEGPRPWAKAVTGVLRCFAAVPTALETLRRVRREREDAGRKTSATGWKGACTVLLALSVASGVLLVSVLLVVKLGSLTLPLVLQGAGTPLHRDDRGATTILLLGQGDEAHDGIDLTDSILVASVEPDRTGSIVLLSLPRDLYFLHTQQMGPGHLNALYRDHRNTLIREQRLPYREASLQALGEVKEEIGRALGLPVHYAVKVDFTAAEALVDAVGGVDINVASTIDDPQYPGPNYTFDPFRIDAGPQHLDGATALKYARSRATSSDFDRSARQQQILSAVSAKAREIDVATQPGKVRQLLGILTEHVETDLTVREIATLGSLAAQLDPSRVVSFQLSNVNGLYGEPLTAGGLLYSPPRDLFAGAAVLLPVSIPEFPVTWRQIQTFTNLIFDHREIYMPAPRSPAEQGEVGPPTIAVYNGGAPEGAARKLANELTKFGFEVGSVTNFPGEDVARSFLAVQRGEEEAIAAFLSSLLRLDRALPEQAATIRAEGDLAIVLGPEYRFQPLQDLPPSPPPPA